MIARALGALEQVAHPGMGLEALEFLERRQIRVLIVQVHHEADRHQVVAVVIEERSAADVIAERPPERVLHHSAAVLLWLHLPEFFETDAELLRFVALVEAELGD